MTERYAHLCPITESQNLISKDSDTTLNQASTVLASLIAEKGAENIPQAVLDWLAKVD